MAQRSVKVRDIKDVSEEVNIAVGDISIYKGYTVEQVSILLKEITSTFQPKAYDGRCPYKGLDGFKESRGVFFTEHSGSGKSSMVQADLNYALKQGAIKNLHSERWLYETMRPGRESLGDLALVFSRLKSPELEKYFREHVNETSILHECTESVRTFVNDKKQPETALFRR